MSKITLKEFFEYHKEMTPKINTKEGSPGFFHLLRIWNSFAILFPEKVDSYVAWPINSPEPFLKTETFKGNKQVETKASSYNQNKKDDKAVEGTEDNKPDKVVINKKVS